MSIATVHLSKPLIEVRNSRAAKVQMSQIAVSELEQRSATLICFAVLCSAVCALHLLALQMPSK